MMLFIEWLLFLYVLRGFLSFDNLVFRLLLSVVNFVYLLVEWLEWRVVRGFWVIIWCFFLLFIVLSWFI